MASGSIAPPAFGGLGSSERHSAKALSECFAVERDACVEIEDGDFSEHGFETNG